MPKESSPATSNIALRTIIRKKVLMVFMAVYPVSLHL